MATVFDLELHDGEKFADSDDDIIEVDDVSFIIQIITGFRFPILIFPAKYANREHYKNPLQFSGSINIFSSAISKFSLKYSRQARCLLSLSRVFVWLVRS